MKINWIVVGIVIIFALILIVFLIIKNQKEQKKYTDFLNNDFKKADEEESDLNDDTY
ncbi:EGFR-like transmembrane domain-containing protein [Flavobacterium caseinilyticum]|uniref:EGFR-like transmembrane domain-containing protein n=1 Tax=Flavobacterium caseinilyticum TaxID=2541732 RepID=UPI00140473B0|nr:transmembrane domain-containing protein [Flavobacterium caseinilyticum]